ncbi:MAG: AAA family ATPase [Fimbriiglobus sp.]
MAIRSLTIHDVPPFAKDTVLNFEPSTNPELAETHIIVGENGTGKTRLLSMLLSPMGSQEGARRGIASELTQRDSIGIRYQSYYIKLDIPLQMQGLSLRTHPFNIASSYQIFKEVAINKPIFQSFIKPDDFYSSVGQFIVNNMGDAALANLTDDSSNPSASIVKKICEVISFITGRKFIHSIHVLSRGQIDISIKWGNVSMPFSNAPDGLKAIFQLLNTASLYALSMTSNEPDIFQRDFTIIMDEPELHLHPRWQRYILPTLQKLFPKCQIICATHSPFVVSSVNEGYVHILRVDPADGKVRADAPKACSRGDTYRDAVNEIFGIDGPEEYDPETEILLKQFDAKRGQLTKESDLGEIETLAKTIAARSDRLNYYMGGQLRQLKLQREMALKDSNP